MDFFAMDTREATADSLMEPLNYGRGSSSTIDNSFLADQNLSALIFYKKLNKQLTGVRSASTQFQENESC
jgi:hypothetical protein